MDVTRCNGDNCASDAEYKKWIEENAPRFELNFIEETVNWNLPISNKRPVFESVRYAGSFVLNDNWVTAGIMDL